MAEDQPSLERLAWQVEILERELGRLEVDGEQHRIGHVTAELLDAKASLLAEQRLRDQAEYRGNARELDRKIDDVAKDVEAVKGERLTLRMLVYAAALSGGVSLVLWIVQNVGRP